MQESRRKDYLLFVLMVILTFNFVDRLALGIVLQDIKGELQLTDTQLGVLGGIAFAFFYAVMGIPIAYWADRGDRVTIIGITTLLWSAAVALCGAATTFAQLLLIRIAVAVGEAGCLPTGQSLIADYFSRAERARAAAIYLMGGPLSLVIGYFAAGWLNELVGWRMTFVVLGVPGVLLGALAWATLHEPRRERPIPRSGGGPGILQVVRVLWSNTTFRNLLFAFSVLQFFNYGLLQWQPSFFMRSHGLTSGELGTWLAAIYGVGGLLGTYLGGELASRYAPHDEALQLMLIAVGFALLGFVKAGMFLAPTHVTAFALLAIAIFAGALTSGPLFGTLQTLVRPEMRAMAVALIYFFANLIGMGLGPLAAGALSDGFRPWAGNESLRYALLILCFGYVLSTFFLLRARRTVARDLLEAQAEPPASAHVSR